MPFTLAHPVAVFPLLKKSFGFSATALIIGSMMPDFEYFFQLREVENIGHHGYGVLPFDLPITIILCLVFHKIIKKPLLQNLPDFLRNRTRNAYDIDFVMLFKKKPFIVVISALIGVLTHLFFDGFTHHDGFMVEMIPYLSTTVLIAEKSIKVFFVLQLLFSLIGCGVVLYWIYKIKPEAVGYPRSAGSTYWWLFFVIYIVVLGVRVIVFSQYNSFWGIIMAILGSFLYALLFASLIEKVRTLRKN